VPSTDGRAAHRLRWIHQQNLAYPSLWNRRWAARILGVSAGTIRYRIKKLNLTKT
jgi:transcriptional regulator with AAA-type ATPase domain